jgi:hypothetical protein
MDNHFWTLPFLVMNYNITFYYVWMVKVMFISQNLPMIRVDLVTYWNASHDASEAINESITIDEC